LIRLHFFITILFLIPAAGQQLLDLVERTTELQRLFVKEGLVAREAVHFPAYALDAHNPSRLFVTVRSGLNSNCLFYRICAS